MADYYKTLGLGKGASNEEIKKAYRKLALEYHPDRGGDKESEKKFKEINEAYQVLSDPKKKANYDQFGSADFGGGNAGFEGFDFGGFRSQDFGNSSSHGFDFGGGLGDIFDDFFGQAFSTINAQIEITPAQAVLGDKIRINVAGENIELNIPSGTQSGTTFAIRGKGKQYKGGKRGDLNITIKVQMPTKITPEQKELWEQLREAESKKRSWWK